MSTPALLTWGARGCWALGLLNLALANLPAMTLALGMAGVCETLKGGTR